MSGHNKPHIQYAGKAILLRGLITCHHCGCAVSGDIKKQKYIYYSCNNSKRICKKIWIREEKIVEQLLKNFDGIALDDSTSEKIVEYLKQAHNEQQDFFRKTQQALSTELGQVQRRLSKLVDAHLDGTIDASIYESKTKE